ncbi:ASCH domain-containing protein [Marinobacterium sedimentorum]|uniref:ASCH domain-containing protein n=1 Tax=Marinobacterium sedimentorum TaxID=2927804 RepID=UPI0020C6D498|nr:ASCH domain-containing protein [Marinobacterium sedimentorum]MCP8686081.1 hypothetical protein [Marinobacterium sedimentorum]
MSEIILSIKPFYADKIFSGAKKIELRKRVGRLFFPGNIVYIYSSSPVKEVTGFARISQVERLAVSDIRDRFLHDACIAKKDFDSYYEGHKEGVAVWLRDIVHFKNGAPLSILRSSGFNPPQSYCYLSPTVKKILGEYL